MFSTIVPNSSIICLDNGYEMVLYPLRAEPYQIVLSQDGILYLRDENAGLIINNSHKLGKIKKKDGSFFNKASESVEILFEFDKVYVCYGLNFYLFCFNHTHDGSVICTKIDINAFSRYENVIEYKNYTELNDFLHYVDEYKVDANGNSQFFTSDPITGKFIISNGIDYAKFFNSEVVLKNPLSNFNKNQISIKLSEELKILEKKSINSNNSIIDEQESEKLSCIKEKILQTIQDETELKNEMEYQNTAEEEISFCITETMRNYLIITGIDSLEIYDFYVFCNGENNFKVEYQKVNLECFSDVKEVFSHFQVKI